MKFDDNMPIYIQIMNECKRKMITGEYQPGMKVAPVRELALTFGVNPNTVQRAMQELEREGYFITERTTGRHVCEDVELIASLKKDVVYEKISSFLREMELYGCREDEIMQKIKELSEEGDHGKTN